MPPGSGWPCSPTPREPPSSRASSCPRTAIWRVRRTWGQARRRPPARLCPAAPAASRALAQQEVERRTVEGLRVLVQPGVRQVVEDDELAPGDPAVDGLGESRRADQVARPD